MSVWFNAIIGILIFPAEGCGGFVVLPNVTDQLSGEVGCRSEDSASNNVALDFGKPDLDLIEPTGVGRSVVDPKRWTGDASTSEADIRLTRRLGEGARILQINILDHINVGQPFDGRPGYSASKKKVQFDEDHKGTNYSPDRSRALTPGASSTQPIQQSPSRFRIAA